MPSFLRHDLISFRFNELSAVAGSVVSKSEISVNILQEKKSK